MSYCRICSGKLSLIIDFGKISLVGIFLKKVKKIKKYALSLNYCNDCKHVQIKEILKRDLLFRNYLWETGISKSNINLINEIIKKLKKNRVNKTSKILEIASNDGSFLKKIREKFKCFVLGVDPAKNLKKLKKNKDILTINDYFDKKLSSKIKKKFESFDYIFARNVIAHVPNPNEIFSGVKNLLKEDGLFILEAPHLFNIFKDNQYDNIFHEHIGFHSFKSIIDLCTLNNLRVLDVELIKSQGGSLRCYIGKKNTKKKSSRKINSVLSMEKKIGLYNSKKLENFKNKILNHIQELKNLIEDLKMNKKKISIYGASGKGQALMQFCNINKKLVDNVYDKSKLKQGKYTPGTNIKVKNPKEINSKKIDFLLLLSWNIKEEILKQEKKFVKHGGKFIVPFPKPRILN